MSQEGFPSLEHMPLPPKPEGPINLVIRPMSDSAPDILAPDMHIVDQNLLEVTAVMPITEVAPSPIPRIVHQRGEIFSGDTSHDFGLAARGSNVIKINKKPNNAGGIIPSNQKNMTSSSTPEDPYTERRVRPPEMIPATPRTVEVIGEKPGRLRQLGRKALWGAVTVAASYRSAEKHRDGISAEEIAQQRRERNPRIASRDIVDTFFKPEAQRSIDFAKTLNPMNDVRKAKEVYERAKPHVERAARKAGNLISRAAVKVVNVAEERVIPAIEKAKDKAVSAAKATKNGAARAAKATKNGTVRGAQATKRAGSKAATTAASNGRKAKDGVMSGARVAREAASGPLESVRDLAGSPKELLTLEGRIASKQRRAASARAESIRNYAILNDPDARANLSDKELNKIAGKALKSGRKHSMLDAVAQGQLASLNERKRQAALSAQEVEVAPVEPSAVEADELDPEDWISSGSGPTNNTNERGDAPRMFDQDAEDDETPETDPDEIWKQQPVAEAEPVEATNETERTKEEVEYDALDDRWMDEKDFRDIAEDAYDEITAPGKAWDTKKSAAVDEAAKNGQDTKAIEEEFVRKAELWSRRRASRLISEQKAASEKASN